MMKRLLVQVWLITAMVFWGKGRAKAQEDVPPRLGLEGVAERLETLLGLR